MADDNDRDDARPPSILEVERRFHSRLVRFLFWSGAFFWLMLVYFICNGNSTNPPDPPSLPAGSGADASKPSVASTEPTPADANPAYRLVETFTGSGAKTTKAFHARAPWKIAYHWTKTDVYPTLSVTVNDADNSMVALAANTDTPGADESWVHQSGTFHLDIMSTSARYTVKIWAPQ